MTPVKLRDRDAILTKENIIFRVYGYFHPPGGYICDPEYAAADIFQSKDPRAKRGNVNNLYYKFYADEGLQFVSEKYTQYSVFHESLHKSLVGVPNIHVLRIRKPNEEFKQLITIEPRDKLLKALHRVFQKITSSSQLSKTNFGIFGSLLHRFYHPMFSDIDLVVYGHHPLEMLRERLDELYQKDSSFRNEFETEAAIYGKNWRFVNYSLKDYLWHQKRKMIYAVFRDLDSSRDIKVEFEPVMTWNDIDNEYDPKTQIERIGWMKAFARITSTQRSAYIPSIYQIELLDVVKGPKIDGITRILSYVEEFRMQAKPDERVLVEGPVEQVNTGTKTFHQIILTYGPRYYEQVLKVLE